MSLIPVVMRVQGITDFIDNKISKSMIDGYALLAIIDDFTKKIENFKKRDNFVPVSKEALINNWDSFKSREKYTTLYILHSRERIKDIMWIQENKPKFPGLSNSQLFNLVKLRNKLKP